MMVGSPASYRGSMDVSSVTVEQYYIKFTVLLLCYIIIIIILRINIYLKIKYSINLILHKMTLIVALILVHMTVL